MTGADSAAFAARARADLILGIRRPKSAVHARLMQIETWLRYAVPGLLAAFLICLAGVAALHLRAHREDVTNKAKIELETVARLTAAALADKPREGGALQQRLHDLLPTESHLGRRALVFGSDERILAAYPPMAADDARLLFGEDTRFRMARDREGTITISLADGREAIAASRPLAGGGQVTVLQPVEHVTAGWWKRMRNQAILLFAAALVIIGIGIAYSLQTRRAYAADQVCEQVRQRLDAALGRGRCGLWDWDISRGTIFWSDSMYALLGYTPERDLLSFGRIEAMLHPEDGDLLSHAQRLAGHDTTLDHEFRIRGSEGEWVWLRARAEVITDATDGGRHLVGIAVDVTEQRRLAESSATADMRLRDAVEAISEAFVLWDDANRMVLCNSKFRVLHAIAAEDAVPGRRYHEIMGRGALPNIRRELPESGRPGSGARNFEIELSDGRWLQVSERRTKDGGYVSVGTDITNLKRNQERLVASERELIETIKDLKASRRTLELQTQQLADLAERQLDQRAQAESANQAKSEFLANMSHELRTPLNAIMGFADLMQSECYGRLGSPRYTEYCRDILSSGAYLLSVIDDILHMARIEARRIVPDRRLLAVEPAVSGAIKLVAETARGKDVSLHVELQPRLTVFADERALQQMLTNLLQNAVKFTNPHGQVALRGRGCGRFVHLFIEDSGIGIPKTAQAKLGRPFEQVENNLTRSHKGAGLGLAIARSTAEMHGGTLRIRSEPGIGTIVLLRLPALGPVQPAAAEQALIPHLMARGGGAAFPYADGTEHGSAA